MSLLALCWCCYLFLKVNVVYECSFTAWLVLFLFSEEGGSQYEVYFQSEN